MSRNHKEHVYGRMLQALLVLNFLSIHVASAKTLEEPKIIQNSLGTCLTEELEYRLGHSIIQREVNYDPSLTVTEEETGKAYYFSEPGLQINISRHQYDVTYDFTSEYGFKSRLVVHLSPQFETPPELQGNEKVVIPKDWPKKPVLPVVYGRSLTAQERLPYSQYQDQRQTDILLTMLYRSTHLERYPDINISLTHEKINLIKLKTLLQEGQLKGVSPDLFLPRHITDHPFYVEDPNTGQAVGAANFNGIYGIYMRGIKENFDDPFETFFKYIRTNSAILKTTDRQVGIGLHVDYTNGKSSVVQFISLGKFKREGLVLSNAYKNLPEDTLNFVMNIYRNRLGHLPGGDFSLDREISRNVANRSNMIVWSEGDNSFTIPNFTQDQFDRVGRLPYSLSERNHLKIRGALTAVWSSGANEPLPVELLLNSFFKEEHLPLAVRLPRPDGKKVLELGRFAVEDGAGTPISKKLLQASFQLAGGMNDIETVYASADDAHFRIYKKMGFRDVPPEDLFPGDPVKQKMIKKWLEDHGEHIIQIPAKELAH